MILLSLLYENDKGAAMMWPALANGVPGRRYDFESLIQELRHLLLGFIKGLTQLYREIDDSHLVFHRSLLLLIITLFNQRFQTTQAAAIRTTALSKPSLAA